MARRPLPTGPADWLVLLVTPALLMVMVSSLLFFVLAIFLRDAPFNERLHWILFACVAGMVLIGRITLIDEIAKRASTYTAILGVLVLIALLRFVPPPAGWGDLAHGTFCLALVVGGFWVTRVLVIDTTDIHSESEVSGEGLLRAAGLEDDPSVRLRKQVERSAKGGSKSARKDIDATADEEDGDAEAGMPVRGNRRRPPGVSVVWFAALALPLFGLGQAFIPAEDLKTRWYTLTLLMVYLACSFLLLLTSSFLGFRRYLARRGLRMPATMAAVWIVGGMLLVGCVLLLTLVIPRPSDIGPANTIARLLGRPIHPEKAKVEGNQGQGATQPAGMQANDKRDDDQGRQQVDPNAKAHGKAGAKGDGQGGDKAGQGKQGGGKAGVQSGPGQQQDGKAVGNKDEAGKGGAGKKDEGKEKGGNGAGKPVKEGDGNKAGEKQKGGEKKSGEPAQPPPPSSGGVGQVLESLRKLFLFVIVGVVLGVVAIFFFTCLSQGWSPAETLNRWLAWLQGLFNRDRDPTTKNVGPVEAIGEKEADGRGFSDFSDPFQAKRKIPERELVRVTFQAVQAWGRDQHYPMQEGETPNEYFRRLGEEHPGLKEGLGALAQWHDLAEYAQDEPLEGCHEPLRILWRELRLRARGEHRSSVASS